MRQLGDTNLRITPVGIGAFAMGGWMWGGQDDAQSEAAIRAALDAGINWIDSAPIYGEGKASEAVGRVLKKMPSDQRPLVFTKFGHHLIDGERVTNACAANVEKDCEEELARLGVERLDLFQLHWPAPQPVEETAGACERLLKAGKIRAVGVSNFDALQLAAWEATGVPLHSVQNQGSLVKPKDLTSILPWCLKNNVGTLVYSPLFRGLLTGTWDANKTFPPGDHRGERDDFRGERLKRGLQAVEELRTLGREYGLSVPQLAVGWLLFFNGVTGVIVGARTAEQAAALGNLAVSLTQRQFDAVDVIAQRYFTSTP